MNTVIRHPPTNPPLLPIPEGLNQFAEKCIVPTWWLNTQYRPQTANTIRITYSMMPMVAWVRAVIRMPTMEIAAITTTRAVAMSTFGHLLLAEELKTDRTDGPSAV